MFKSKIYPTRYQAEKHAAQIHGSMGRKFASKSAAAMY